MTKHRRITGLVGDRADRRRRRPAAEPDRGEARRAADGRGKVIASICWRCGNTGVTFAQMDFLKEDAPDSCLP